jgi:hypothetical protein
LALRLGSHGRRCKRRREKQSYHSKRSEEMRPKTFLHKSLQTGTGSTWNPQKNCSAILQITANSITIAGKLQDMEPARRYFDADPRAAAAAGFANFAAATGAFGCTFVSSVVDCPSTQVVVHLKGILTPPTAR